MVVRVSNFEKKSLDALFMLQGRPSCKQLNLCSADIEWTSKQVKFNREQSTKPRRGLKAYLYSFFNRGARWGGWTTPRSGRFTPRKDTVCIVQEAVWAPGPVWTGAENLAPTGIRSPDPPTHSESLYRLSYHDPQYRAKKRQNMLG